MINWNIVPMIYNDSFTYMEWLGKLNYIAENHEERIDAAEKEIIVLWAKVNDHEGRIVTLEDWRRDIVDPFIEATTETLADHEERITAAEHDIDALQDWKLNTVDPFIVDITGWKNNTVNPFISTINSWKTDTVDPFITSTNNWKTNTVDPFIATATNDINKLKSDLTAEAATRQNDDNTLAQKLNQTDLIAKDAQTKVNKIDIDLQNIGTIRYFLATPDVDGVGGNTALSVTLPDEDWSTIDVRFGVVESNVVQEFRVTGLITETSHQTTVNGVNFWFAYESSTNSVTVTAMNKSWSSNDIFRFDYILYKSALTPDEQEQRDIDFFNAMDTNGDGKVNASDASMILNYYAAASTGQIPDEYEGKAAWEYYADNINTNADRDAYPDFNGDGKINASDSSFILGYYSFASTTDLDVSGPELMRIYRTQLEENNG